MEIKVLFFVLVGLLCANCQEDHSQFIFADGYECAPITPFDGMPERLVVHSHAPVLFGELGDPNVFAIASLLAFEDVQNSDCILPGIDFHVKATEAAPFPATESLKEFLRVAQEPEGLTIANAGAVSSVARVIAIAAPMFDVPQLSCCASSPEFSDKNLYPLFSRITAPDDLQAKIVVQMAVEFRWSRMCVISTATAFGSALADTFISSAVASNISVMSSQSFSVLSTFAERSDDLFNAVKSTQRAGCKTIFIAMHDTEFVQFLMTAVDQGYTHAHYVAGDSIHSTDLYTIEGVFRQDMYDALEGAISVLPNVPSGPVADAFVTRYNALPQIGDATYHVFAAYFYDNILVGAKAMDRLLRKGMNPNNSTLLVEEIRQTVTEGLTGPIVLDPKGDRIMSFTIMNLRSVDGFEPIGQVPPGANITFNIPPTFKRGSEKYPESATLIYVDYDEPRAIAMLTICGLGIVLTLLGMTIIFTKSRSPIIAYSSPRFVLLISIGILILYCNVFVWTGRPTDSLCQARPWMLMMGFALVFGPLFAKAGRIYKFMTHKKFTATPISDMNLFSIVGVYCALFVIPLIVWTAAYPLEATRDNGECESFKQNLICDGENATGFLVYFLFLTLGSITFGIFLTFLLRHINDFFSEFPMITYTMYMTSISITVALPLMFLLDDSPDDSYLVYMIAIIFSATAALLLLVYAKIFVVFFDEESNHVPTNGTGGIQRSNQTSTM